MDQRVYRRMRTTEKMVRDRIRNYDKSLTKLYIQKTMQVKEDNLKETQESIKVVENLKDLAIIELKGIKYGSF